jgi:transposase
LTRGSSRISWVLIPCWRDSVHGSCLMGQPIEITRTEYSAAALRGLAGKTDDGAMVRRLLAMALVLEGESREEAASLNGMTRQTLRDWVHRYNAEGVAGLRSRTGPGRPPALSAAQMEELREIVLKGPDPERHIVVRWRCADLCEEVAERWSVRVCEQTMGRWLRRLEMTRLQPRPYHPKKDPKAEEAFSRLVKASLPETAAGKPIEIWFQDEARVGQHGSLEYIWAPIGSRPLAVRDNRHDSAYLFGALCPSRATGAAIIMPAANSEAMNEHLKEIATQVSPGAHAVLVCDGAGWHQRGERLQVPENITLLPLPPYSPELNPMENVWDYLRGNKLSHSVWDTYDAIVRACAEAWRFLLDDPKRISSVAMRSWACGNV